MKLFIIIFSLISFFIFSGPCAFADDNLNIPALSEYQDYPPEIDLGTIVITPKRFQSQTGQAAENISVYTKGQIEELPAKDLADVLEVISGVDVQVTNKLGQPTSISIQGSDSRDVLLMVDGIPFNTQLSGQANPMRIGLEDIERIEVIKGASSSAWGSSLGGVINVITKDVGDTVIPKGEIKSSFAEFSTTKNSLELKGKVSDLGYYINGSYFETDGTRSVSSVEDTKAFGKLSLPLGDEAKLTGSFGYSGVESSDGVRPNNRWYNSPSYARYGKILLEAEKNDYNADISYKFNNQDITSDTYNATTGAGTFSSISRNFYQGISLVNSFKLRENDLFIAGADFDWHKLKSSNYLDSSKSISMQAPYANYTLELGKWNIIPGLRYDHNAQFGSQTSPSLGAVYHFEDSRESLLRAKISRAFNAPPLLWIYNDAPGPPFYIGPNPLLKAERAIVYEAGFETELISDLKMKLDLYRADVKDGIVTKFGGGVLFKDNVDKIRRQGAELRLDYKPIDDLTLYTSAAFNEAKNKTNDQIIRDVGIARQAYKLGMNYRHKSGFGAHLLGYYNRWSSPPDSQANDRKFIVDLKFTQDFENVMKDTDLEIFLSVYNLTNSKYWADISFPAPERYFEGGFVIKF